MLSKILNFRKPATRTGLTVPDRGVDFYGMTRHSIRLCGQVIDRPGHICAFFDSREQEYETLLPYFREGLDDGEQVVNVLDADRLNDHTSRLHGAGIDPSDVNLSLSSSEETYLSGGSFDMDRMVGFVRGHLEKAYQQGQRVRTAGWMDWLHREAPGTERAIEYEARMNLLVPDFDCTFMCIYDLAKLDGQTVVDVMATHPYVIMRGKVRENTFYVPPENYLRELLTRTGRTGVPPTT